MGINGFKVVGGRMQFTNLTSKLTPVEYSVGKVNMWLCLLKDKKVPKKWFKATKNGTKVDFICPQTQSEWDTSYATLKAYIDAINDQYDIDLEIVRDKKGESA